jgi:hypothetical protein
MKSILTISLTVLAFAAMAQSLPPNPADPANKTPRMERYKHAAGLVSRVIKDGKCIRFLDIRKEGVAITNVVEKMPQSFDTKVEIVKATAEEGACPMTTAKKAFSDDKVGAVIVIANQGADMPALTVCPEDRMGVINADRLSQDLPDEGGEEVLAKRFTKEMWRAVAFVLGGYEAQYPCVMKSAFSPADLDANPLLMTCPPVSGAISKNAQRFGFAKVQCVPYFIAVRQGWAPPPANDAQREEVERFEKMKAARAITNAVPAKVSTPAK